MRIFQLFIAASKTLDLNYVHMLDENYKAHLNHRFEFIVDYLNYLDFRKMGTSLTRAIANTNNHKANRELFYIPKEVMATGEIIFDTELVKMDVDIKSAEKAWKSALKLLNSDCPGKFCEWCEGK